jgi:2',3'-cyclic-nucleotide 2'-phosphodiesterase (5'-nucleotidase family)
MKLYKNFDINIILFLVGNLVTDAIVDYHANFSHPESRWAPAAIAVWNAGGIRSSIDKGNVKNLL